jgi:hypothetical protein
LLSMPLPPPSASPPFCQLRTLPTRGLPTRNGTRIPH